MTDLFTAGLQPSAPTCDRIPGRFAASLSHRIRRLFHRKGLLAELEALPDGMLQDIGMTKSDLTTLQNTPVQHEGLARLIARQREHRRFHAE